MQAAALLSALMGAKGLTMRELGEKLGLTRQRVEQLHAAGRLSHKPRKVAYGSAGAFFYLFPNATTKTGNDRKPGRPKKPLDKVQD